MDLKRLSENARSAERLRARLLKTGLTVSGSKLWVEEEDLVCRLFYPDYFAIRYLLPTRTKIAIQARCSKLGLTRTYHQWGPIARQRLRKLYPTASRSELCHAFPGIPWESIQSAARYYGFRRVKKPYKITGILALDQVRRRCYDIKWIMRDLDSEARTRTYFQTRGYRSTSPDFKAIRKAVRALGGDMHVQWLDAIDCD